MSLLSETDTAKLQKKYLTQELCFPPPSHTVMQLCMICKDWIRISDDRNGITWLHVGDMVRHKRCRPEPIR